MRSSEHKKAGEGVFLRGPVYSILAVYIPFSFLIALFLVSAALLSAPPLSVSLPYGLFCVTSLISALAASCYYHVMSGTKSGHTGADIRGTVILLALVYLAVSLTRVDRFVRLDRFDRFDQSLGLRFLPGLSNSIAVLTSLYSVISVTALKRLFGSRENFERHTNNREGEKLRELISEDAAALWPDDGAPLKIKIAWVVQLLLILILTVICAVLNIRLPPALYGVSILLVINEVFIFTFINIFKTERYYAGEGLTLAEGDRLGHIAGIIVFTAAGTGAAFLPVSEKNTLPFSLIRDFFAWLLSLLPRFSPQAAAGPAAPDLPELMPPPPMLPDFLAAEKDAEPWPIWEWLQYAFIGLLAIGFVLFMVKPLFPGNRFLAGDLSLVKKLRRMVVQWLKTLAGFMANCIIYLRGGQSSLRVSGPKAGELRRLSAELLKGYSPAKKREMRNSVTLFARLIIWGIEYCHVPWKPSCAPGEYCALLAGAPAIAAPAAATPAVTMPMVAAPAATGESPGNYPAALIRCGELFEEALYSPSAQSGERQREFKGLVQKITKSAI
ncbi:MAG: hypothetical protein LBQ38_00955 [Spirochaetaceae bacterium]|jgi:hypothetical protein|nr:hypothetical protein [Spirochaetaceae bacterium]